MLINKLDTQPKVKFPSIRKLHTLIMNFTNKITLFLTSILVSFFIIQCTNDEGLFQENFDDPILYGSLEELQLELVQNDTIQFDLPTDETDTTFQTPGGIRLIFPPNSIIPIGGGNGDGGSGGGGETPVPPYTVYVTEIYKRGDFVRNYFQTYQEEFPLVSGGAFSVLVRDANGNLMSVENLQAFVPYKTKATGYVNDMNAFQFIGIPTLAGYASNSSEIQVPIVYDPTAGPTGEFHHANIAGGWNHIGSRLDMTESTQFTVKVTNAPDYFDTRLFFVMDDFTMITEIYTIEGNQLKTLLESVPKNASGKLIAISLIEDQLFFASQDITINGNDHFDLTVAPGTIEELQALLETID